MRIFFAAVLVLGVSAGSFGQGIEAPQYNPNSVNAIPRYEQLYKIRVWREIDFSEKQNEGFFANNGQITKLALDAIRSGEIGEVYRFDSLTSTYPKDEFYSLLVRSEGQIFEPWDINKTYYTNDQVSFEGKNYEAQADNLSGKTPAESPSDWSVYTGGKAIVYIPNDITKMRIMEDLIFDRRRSRLYHDIQAVQFFVPGSSGITSDGFDRQLGWIKYKDLERVFRNHPREAIWFNRYNTAENRNFADAFLLRLFKGVIYKVENPDDLDIQAIYSENGRSYKESVWAREWEEIRLMEKEHNLWEY